MVDFEDVELPTLHIDLSGPERNAAARKNRLLSRSIQKSAGKAEIQLASFHPNFQWSDSEFDDALNFEKRAPFPVINLLRAARVREYANSESTKRISGYNVKSLEATGSELLREELENLIKVALY